MNTKSSLPIVTASLFSALVPTLVQASSFQILEQSPAHLGKAFAGTASDVRDASSVFFNPAAIVKLEGSNLTVGANGIFTNAEFSDINSNTRGIEDKTDKVGLVPNVYWTLPLSEETTIGLGINAPYGLESEYSEDWMGRYLATHSELAVASFSGVLAFELNDQWSLGVGLDYQRAEVTLASQVDSTFGVNPRPATDSHAKIEGDDDDFVGNASLYFTPNERLNIGLVFRQGGTFNLEGDARFTLNPACSLGAGYPTGAPPAPTTGTLCALGLGALAGDAEADVELPDTITLSASHRITDEWQIHGDIALTQWSSIQTIRVRNTDNNLTINELNLQYDDTMRYALGMTYEPSGSPWTWRFGIAIDDAPQTNPAFVSVRIPDEDRLWFGAGFNYKLSPTSSIDVGYAYVDVQKATIENTNPQTGSRVSGEFDSNVQIVGVQANWTF
ncbi:MAG: transporter [Gammaproteobacteria bacterium]|nr:MAG: transporter [Gammaproteobacteria bacterium]